LEEEGKYKGESSLRRRRKEDGKRWRIKLETDGRKWEGGGGIRDQT
jgi:hypothetical protein